MKEIIKRTISALIAAWVIISPFYVLSLNSDLKREKAFNRQILQAAQDSAGIKGDAIYKLYIETR